MDEFPDVDSLDERERAALRTWLRRELADIEILRRSLHERNDLLRAELTRRWRLRVEALGDRAVELAESSGPRLQAIFTGTGDVADGPSGGLPDLAALPDGRIHLWIRWLKSWEDDVSLKRRELHLRIDML